MKEFKKKHYNWRINTIWMQGDEQNICYNRKLKGN